MGLSLVQLAGYLSSVPLPAPYTLGAVEVQKREGSILPRIRQELFEEAIAKGYTHALCLDSDQTFPINTVHHLIAHGKPFVAANVATKTYPALPTARGRGDAKFGVPISSTPWKTGLEKVWRVGIAVALVDLRVVKDIEKPWFETAYDQKTGHFVGEDWHFCAKLEAAGVPLLIDHELSRSIGHVGQFTFTHQHVPAEERAAA